MPGTPTDPVLLVEDTQSLSMIYSHALETGGYPVRNAYTAQEARAAYRDGSYRLILLDLMLPDGDGIDLLREFRQHDPATRVIVVSAHGSINRAVEAMREGAFDFLVKPIDDRKLMSAVKNATEAIEPPTTEPDTVLEPRGSGLAFEGFIGSSRVMQDVYKMVHNIGRSTATVFITGESGTGKEVCANAIHNLSPRKSRAFVPLNCAAIPRDLLESEVFGHVRGAFTGAVQDKQGAAMVADGGTLFLDEICEMDLALQTKLLRFLQTSTVQPLGSTTPAKVDVRIICATNRDPAEEVRAGRFREDLFYRLHVLPIHLPPLKERGEDLIEIAERMLPLFSAEESKTFRRLSDGAKSRLRAMRWPGNVRQLQNVLRKIVVLHDGEEVSPEMIPAEAETSLIAASGNGASIASSVATTDQLSTFATSDVIDGLVGLSLSEMERRFIEATIAQCDGSITRAARILNVSPSTLYRKRESWDR
ncbi:MAG: sigma-54 dependent transcriptional regulator [Pseudomonadota bacterium]